MGLVSGHAEYPLNSRPGSVYSSQAELGFLISSVHKEIRNGDIYMAYKHLATLAEVMEVSLSALEVRGSFSTGKERYFLGGGQGRGRGP